MRRCQISFFGDLNLLSVPLLLPPFLWLSVHFFTRLSLSSIFFFWSCFGFYCFLASLDLTDCFRFNLKATLLGLMWIDGLICPRECSSICSPVSSDATRCWRTLAPHRHRLIKNSNSWTKQSCFSFHPRLPPYFMGLCARRCSILNAFSDCVLFTRHLLCVHDMRMCHCFSVRGWPLLCILNDLWPFSISPSKLIKVRTNQEMVSAVVSCWYSHSSLSGLCSDHWHVLVPILYQVWEEERPFVSLN